MEKSTLISKETLLEEYKATYWEQKKVHQEVDQIRAFRLDKLIEKYGLSAEIEKFKDDAWIEYESIINKLSSELFDLMIESNYEVLSANKEKLIKIREKLERYDYMGYIRARTIKKLIESEYFKQMTPDVQIEVCVRWCTL